MRIRRNLVGCMIAALVVGGCGGGSHHDSSGDSLGSPSIRTVDVEMRDSAYVPTTAVVKAGETVQFAFHNVGKITHDAFLGDEAAQAAHEKQMNGGDMGGMDDGHHDSYAIKIEPGEIGSLEHTFKPGESIIIGCHQPGHYQAGMKLTVTVS